jgi:hypothetical protein
LDQQSRDPTPSFAARRRRTNRLIAIGLACCIVTILAATVVIAIGAHSLSGRPLIQ